MLKLHFLGVWARIWVYWTNLGRVIFDRFWTRKMPKLKIWLPNKNTRQNGPNSARHPDFEQRFLVPRALSRS